MFKSIKIFSTRIDLVTMDEAKAQIFTWTKQKGKHYVVTPNVEFLMASRQDVEFRQILNQADLAIPDSARFGWASAMISERNLFKRLLLWPTFFFKDFPGRESLPVVTGVDLMQELCRESVIKSATIGLLGGQKGVALKLKECLGKKYPGIKIIFAEAGGKVSTEGDIVNESQDDNGNLSLRSKNNSTQSAMNYPLVDILFVAFGQVKQEKWIVKHRDQVPAKVFIGVGGAFDYLSGNVPRAPKWLQNLGLEWLFRLMIQPWRIKRFGALVKFVLLIP